MSLRTARHLLLWAAVLASSSRADEPLALPPAGPGALKIDAKKPALGPAAARKKAAHDVAQGYYEALARGDFAVAGSFVHPDTIRPLREALMARIKTAAPGPQAATLRALGVADLLTLETQSDARFFETYARSQYGTALRVMSTPGVTTRVAVQAVSCDDAVDACDVTVRLTSTTADGQSQVNENRARVAKYDGRYLLGANPPRRGR